MCRISWLSICYCRRVPCKKIKCPIRLSSGYAFATSLISTQMSHWECCVPRDSSSSISVIPRGLPASLGSIDQWLVEVVKEVCARASRGCGHDVRAHRVWAKLHRPGLMSTKCSWRISSPSPLDVPRQCYCHHMFLFVCLSIHLFPLSPSWWWILPNWNQASCHPNEADKKCVPSEYILVGNQLLCPRNDYFRADQCLSVVETKFGMHSSFGRVVGHLHLSEPEFYSSEKKVQILVYNSPARPKAILRKEERWLTDVGHNSWRHMKSAQHAAHNPKFEKTGLFRHPRWWCLKDKKTHIPGWW